MKKAQTKVEGQLDRIGHKWNDFEPESPMGCITIKIYNKNGDCILVRHENDSPAKTTKNKKTEMSCKSSHRNFKKPPMFKLKKDVVFRDLPNVVGKSITSPTKKIQKKKADMSGKGSTSNKGNLTQTSLYNRKVKEGNTDFTSKLREKLRDDMYEESSESNSAGTFTSRKSEMAVEESKH